MTSSPGLRGWSRLQARRGVLQTTTDARAQRAYSFGVPTLWASNTVSHHALYNTTHAYKGSVHCSHLLFYCLLHCSCELWRLNVELVMWVVSNVLHSKFVVVVNLWSALDRFFFVRSNIKTVCGMYYKYEVILMSAYVCCVMVAFNRSCHK